jgi:hypothetical protein
MVLGEHSSNTNFIIWRLMDFVLLVAAWPGSDQPLVQLKSHHLNMHTGYSLWIFFQFKMIQNGPKDNICLSGCAIHYDLLSFDFNNKFWLLRCSSWLLQITKWL